MGALPTGTVTFLYADIVGSTRLVQQLHDRYAQVLADYRRLIHTAAAPRGGVEVDPQGDACLVAFARSEDALAASVAAQLAIRGFPWPEGVVLSVRMGLHTGEPRIVGMEYIGIDVHRAARIGMAGHGGQILLSETTHSLVCDRLSASVGIRDIGEHHLKDLTGPQRLFQVLAPGLPGDFPPLQSPDRVPNNLPVQLTSFIGREREVAELKHMLSASRLLTLVGAGGAGKTRLALEVATEVLKDFEDGVWLVELAALSDAELVPETVASTLKVAEQAGAPILTTLSEFFRNKNTLLVLDNCEHLVTACARLADTLLRSCPYLRMLNTSREPLHVAGETSYPVLPLSLPDSSSVPVVNDLIKYEGIRLFVERAVAARPSFTPTNENAPGIARLCSRLDGIPLALELAAARVSGLSVEQMATKLDDRFRLLTRGSRTALPHHQTLRAALDWSFNLLSDPEKVVFRRLAVFSGGCTLEAAESVCAGDPLAATDVLDLLSQLADKSLVLFEAPGGEGRYRMLETVRQYAQDLLVASKEAAEVWRRHRTWYLGLAERAEARLRGPEDTMWLDRLEVEHDNLRAALGWRSTGENDAETRLRLAAALFRFWYSHTHWEEGRKWLGTALAGSPDSKSIARVKALHAEGRLVTLQGDYGGALALFDESLALARELEDQNGIAQALEGRGIVTAWQGDLDAATALFEESLEVSRKLQDKLLIARVLVQMGFVARRRGDYAKAVAWCEESLAMFRTLGGKRSIALALRWTGHAVRLKGDLERAVGLYRENLALFGETRDKWIATECIEGLAIIARGQGNAERAARLFGAAETARETFGITHPRPEAGDQESFWAAIRERPEGTPFAAAWAEGRAMTLEQVIEFVLQDQAN